MKTLFILIILTVLSVDLSAREPEYDHIFFDNSLMKESWFYSQVTYQSPGYVLNIKGKLPVEHQQAFTPGNSLEINYVSSPKGDWMVQLNYPQWRGKDHLKQGKYLCLRLYIADKTKKEQLPQMAVALKGGVESAYLPMGNYISADTPKKWLEVKIPLLDFLSGVSPSFKYENSKEIISVLFKQASGDMGEHRIFIDQVELQSDKTAESDLEAPIIKSIKGFERHIDICWDSVDSEKVKYVKIYRSSDNANFYPVGIKSPLFSLRYADYTGIPGRTYFYKISKVDFNYNESPQSPVAKAETREMSDTQLLDMVQEACFRYYWDGAEKASGLALENIPGRKNMIATGASGFGLMALVVGAERGFISRDELLGRLEKIVAFIEKGDRFHGALSHFMDGPTGKVEPFFGKYDDGGDLVETSFFMQGLLTARQYLSNNTAREKGLKQRMSVIWEDVEWDWYKQKDDSPYLYWHWSPTHKWHINHHLIGWNETLITYLLAIAAPAHGVDADMYYSGWASQEEAAQEYRKAWGKTKDGSMYANGNTYYGVPLDVGVSNGGPLFFIHYSFMGLNPNKLTDKYTNYFKNNQNIALINYRYCCENPNKYPNYGTYCWGLTASDGPWGYKAREPIAKMDDGTIAPTGALSSFPYLPEESMNALKYLYRDCGDFLWGEYGFRDAFNRNEDWCANIYMGLNQAPMAVMIENYRTNLIWNLFMSAPEIKSAIDELDKLRVKVK